ncbi:type IV pilus assembly protein FimV [Ramlibacter humi]|uniref:Uncharacterized protein n=1 Tax=Ramlibacter humi TaxID=2530451 RepID=A0A4Z0BZQ6_9BURK|nr:hypothetical protein [Ramlibacter humi]TFZ03798.1 hypothetical protein EZ216_09085 [Ramlibacter humi]
MNQKDKQQATASAGRRHAGGWRTTVSAAVLLLCGTQAAALSLGRIQGTALIGRTLQVSLPVTVNPGEELCLRAELLQPETPPIPLSWRSEPIAGDQVLVRLSSNQLVQEPIVAVRVAVGCADQLTQGFVLLAEPPTPAREGLPVPLVLDRGGDLPPVRIAESSPPAAAPAPAPARRESRAPATAPSPGGMRLDTSISRPQPRAPSAAAAPASRARSQESARAPAPTPRTERAPTGEGRPRLQVDLLDFAIDQAPALKMSGQLASGPVGNAPGGSTPAGSASQTAGAASTPAGTADGAPVLSRQEAGAAWQQVNATPEQRLAAPSPELVAEIKALREQSRKQAEQLQKLNSERDLMRDVLAGIAGAIAVALSLLLWRRSREGAGGPWWQRSRTQPASVHASPGPDSVVDSSFPEEEDAPVRVAPEPDSEWSTPAPLRPAGTAVVGANASGKAHFGDSVLGRGRLPSAEELLDVQENANFFLAVGQPEKAIELLESRLIEHLGASPFLWMDLLDLCRKLDRREDYERVRKEFQRAFAARLPRFEDAELNTAGLEGYPKALSRIELLWPSSKVLKEIEKSLFEDPKPGSIMFDLEASRDLLLLYSIALEVETTREDGSPYDRTAMAALDEDGEPALTTQPVPLMALDVKDEVPEPAVDLDLDFSMLDSTPPAPQPAPAAEPEAAAPATAAAEVPAPAQDDPMLPELDLGGLSTARAEPDAASTEQAPLLDALQLDELKLADAPAPQEPPTTTSGELALDFDLDRDAGQGRPPSA